MSLALDKPAASSNARVSDLGARGWRRGTIGDRGRQVTIGLVNNMPDAALVATERQFGGLIEAAAGEWDVRLRLYALAQVPRSREGLEHVASRYEDAGALRGQDLDALIITGAQPVAADLRQEPYWDALVRVIDWAEANTISTILSCLAAHAGVLRFSGILRRPAPAKISGVYAFDMARTHPLTRGAGRRWLVPHSRYNGLAEPELAQSGYGVLTRSAGAGVDMFVKPMRSLMVFLQGHPEYEADTLAREYRRDVSRYLNGETAAPPKPPQGYFSAEAERALASFQAKAEADRRGETMASFPELALGAATAAPWRSDAGLFYRNWLTLIAARKSEAAHNTSALAARWGG